MANNTIPLKPLSSVASNDAELCGLKVSVAKWCKTRNMVRNPSLEKDTRTGPDGITRLPISTPFAQFTQSTDCLVTVDGDGATHGGQAIHVKRIGGDPAQVEFPVFLSTIGNRIERDCNYVLSFDVCMCGNSSHTLDITAKIIATNLSRTTVLSNTPIKLDILRVDCCPTRVSIPFTALPLSTTSYQHVVLEMATDSPEFFLDAFQLERGEVATSYFDGDFGGNWETEAGASPSIREECAPGGEWIDLEAIGFRVAAVSGLGSPPVELVGEARDTGGRLVEGVRFASRQFGIVGQFEVGEGGMRALLAARGKLASALLGNGTRPAQLKISLQDDCGKNCRSLYVNGHYVSGLEGNIDSCFGERLTLVFEDNRPSSVFEYGYSEEPLCSSKVLTLGVGPTRQNSNTLMTDLCGDTYEPDIPSVLTGLVGSQFAHVFDKNGNLYFAANYTIPGTGGVIGILRNDGTSAILTTFPSGGTVEGIFPDDNGAIFIYGSFGIIYQSDGGPPFTVSAEPTVWVGRRGGFFAVSNTGIQARLYNITTGVPAIVAAVNGTARDADINPATGEIVVVGIFGPTLSGDPIWNAWANKPGSAVTAYPYIKAGIGASINEITFCNGRAYIAGPFTQVDGIDSTNNVMSHNGYAATALTSTMTSPPFPQGSVSSIVSGPDCTMYFLTNVATYVWDGATWGVMPVSSSMLSLAVAPNGTIAYSVPTTFGNVTPSVRVSCNTCVCYNGTAPTDAIIKIRFASQYTGQIILTRGSETLQNVRQTTDAFTFASGETLTIDKGGVTSSTRGNITTKFTSNFTPSFVALSPACNDICCENSFGLYLSPNAIVKATVSYRTAQWGIDSLGDES